MADRSVAKWLWLGSLGVSALILNSAMGIDEKLSSVNEQQSRINNSLSIHINTFQALERGSSGWADGIEHVTNAKDMVGLFEIVDIGRFGLETSLDDFRLANSSPYRVMETDIGLIEVCLDSGNNVLNVSSDDYSSLIDGLDRMESRTEYRFDFINVLGGTDTARAEIGGFCVLLRSDDIREAEA